MKIAVDLHIHSGLSPCSELDMTPNNVIGMAKLKGLDAIALTDHNSMKNLMAFWKVAEENEILLIPGVEITTKEDVHILGLFESMQEALEFQGVLDTHLPQIPYSKKVFGRQVLYNEFDEIIGECDTLLLNAINLSLLATVSLIEKSNGIAIPAHINRGSYSILSNLGFIPPELPITTVEVSKFCDYPLLEKKHPYLKNYNKLINSDAHQLGSILERETFLEVPDYSIGGIIETLKKEIKGKTK